MQFVAEPPLGVRVALAVRAGGQISLLPAPRRVGIAQAMGLNRFAVDGQVLAEIRQQDAERLDQLVEHRVDEMAQFVEFGEQARVDRRGRHGGVAKERLESADLSQLGVACQFAP